MNLLFLFMQVDLDADEAAEDPDVVDDAERGAQTIVISRPETEVKTHCFDKFLFGTFDNKLTFVISILSFRLI